MKLRYSMKEKLEILDTIKPLVEKLDSRLHAEAKLPDEVMKLDAIDVNEFLKACEAAHTKYFSRVTIHAMKTWNELLVIKQDLETVCKEVYA